MGRAVTISTEIPPPLSMVERLDLTADRKERLEATVKAAFVRLMDDRKMAGPSMAPEDIPASRKKLKLTDPVASF